MVERRVDSISIERVLVTVFTILALLGLAKVGVLGWPAHPGVAAQGLYFVTVLLLVFLIFSPFERVSFIVSKINSTRSADSFLEIPTLLYTASISSAFVMLPPTHD